MSSQSNGTSTFPFPPLLRKELASQGRYGLQTAAPLAAQTSFRIGGPAAALLTVQSVPNLVSALNLLRDYQIPFLILGGGSNVLISDSGVTDLVILNQCRQIRWPDQPCERCDVWAESGVSLASLARGAIKRQLAGLAWAVSVPGTLGGAVVGNAGAHDGCLADCFVEATIWQDGDVLDINGDAMQFSYRYSRLKGEVSQPACGPVVLDVHLQLHPDRENVDAGKAEAYVNHRRRTQPVDKSAGSIFKNPPGNFAGRVIEAAGLKGFRIGGASVSEKHANFIVNHGDATAADVIALMNHIRLSVFEQSGLSLEPEIQLIGEWRDDPPLVPLPPQASEP